MYMMYLVLKWTTMLVKKDQEEYLIKELQRRLATAAESYPAFESLSKLFDEKINTNMRILLMDSNFSKTMASMSRAIKGKITTVMDELTADEGNYDKSAEPEVLEVAKRLFDLDTQNYKKKDQDSIVQALDKAQKEFSEFIGPFNDKRYSMDSYGVMCYVVGDHIAAMYGKNYFETPDEWSKKRVVRW